MNRSLLQPRERHCPMRLNVIEKMLLNNPARAMVQVFYEAPLLLRLAGRLEGKRALEIGCGRGIGIEIILNQFGAEHVFAIDVDPAMVARAKSRLSKLSPGRIEIAVGDITAIQAPDASFDAVFDFGAMHHVPVWEDAVREIRRVLKPGGVLIFEEVSKQALDRWVYRVLLDHPKENRFTTDEFIASLERNGIVVGDKLVPMFFGDFFAGVGCRA
jgi:ubiquinone/menaquinone biosynthesis C-methylase UbiE